MGMIRGNDGNMNSSLSVRFRTRTLEGCVIDKHFLVVDPITGVRAVRNTDGKLPLRRIGPNTIVIGWLTNIAIVVSGLCDAGHKTDIVERHTAVYRSVNSKCHEHM
jgi:hypothetical protein